MGYNRGNKTMKTNFNINGISFSMRANFQDEVFNVWGDKMNHYKFVVTIRTENGLARFNYYDSFANWQNGKTELNAEDLKGALDCFLSDGSCFASCIDFEDFCSNMGYTSLKDYKKAMMAYNGCKRHHNAACRIFGENYTDILNALYDEE